MELSDSFADHRHRRRLRGHRGPPSLRSHDRGALSKQTSRSLPYPCRRHLIPHRWPLSSPSSTAIAPTSTNDRTFPFSISTCFQLDAGLLASMAIVAHLKGNRRKKKKKAVGLSPPRSGHHQQSLDAITPGRGRAITILIETKLTSSRYVPPPYLLLPQRSDAD